MEDKENEIIEQPKERITVNVLNENKNQKAQNKLIIALCLAFAIVCIGFISVRSIVKNAVRAETATYVKDLDDAQNSNDELKSQLEELSKTIEDMKKAGISSETVKESISEAVKLQLIDYDYTAVIVYTKDNKLFNKVKVPFTENRFIATIEGSIVFGVDIEEIDVDVEENVVVVTCPHSKIISSGAKPETLKVFDEKKNVFNKLDPQGYNDLIVQLAKDEEEKVLANGLDKKADNKLKSVIENNINALCGKDIKVIIDWK